MKKLLIALVAAATTQFASADWTYDDWFSANASATPNTEVNAAWSASPEIVDGKFVIDDDVTLTPSAVAPDTDTTTKIVVDATMTPSKLADLAPLDSDVQTAIAVAYDDNNITNFYAWVKNTNTLEGEWIKLTCANPGDGVLNIELDYTTAATKVRFSVQGSDASVAPTILRDDNGNDWLTLNTNARALNSLAFSGDGTISTIDTDVGRGVAVVSDGNVEEKYPTYASALEAALLNGQLVDTVTILKPSPGETFNEGALVGYVVDPNDKLIAIPTWAGLLGDAVVDGAYEIDNLAELKTFQYYVGTLDTANLTFKLTDDILLEEPWPGIGIQNGKDLANNDAGPAKNAQFDAGAFQGTFDGQDHTIVGFQMVGGGLDYCGFFNSIYGATIQNLKIQYAGDLFAEDTAQNSSLESGATFVGVAKNSTLRNLTALALTATVSCDKGFGGIVGYLMAGTTVDSCTNNVNMVSLKPNKCGGIAMITQSGSGTAVISNCQNNGTVAGSNEIGSFIGYISAPTTTVVNCESTVANKLFHHQSNVVTVSGITADATVASYTGAATPGLNFATVDNGVATFVADDALVADGTVEYKVMNASAAYAFAAPGSIVLDGTLTTAAVTAADSLILTNDATTPVTTYTAVQAVAKIGDTKYATLAAAVDEYEDGDVIEFISAPASDDLAVLKGDGTTIKFKLDTGYIATFYALKAASGYATGTMYFLPDEDNAEYVAFDVSEIDRVAQLTHDGTSTWYSSFKQAWSNAASSGDSLIVNIDGNFVPEFESSKDASKSFASVTFQTESADALTIATTANGVSMTAATWVAPANATLTLGANQTVTSINAGTLEVPAGVKIVLPDTAANITISTLKGEGRLSCKGRVTNVSLQGRLQNADNWHGTMEMHSFDFSSGVTPLQTYGNKNSTVCFNYAGLALANNQNDVKALEIGPSGFDMLGVYAYGTFTLPCALTGSGAINVKIKNSSSGTTTKDVKFTGDVSGFTGNISFDDEANARIVFGTGTYSTSTGTKSIIVTPGTKMTLPSAATWNAPGGIVINGDLDVQGTLANKLSGGGTVKFHSADKAVAAASDWTGTYRVAWNPGNDSTAFNITNYCGNDAATIELMEDITGAYPAPQKLTVEPTIKLSANWTINNGWQGSDNVTTFAKLTGTGNLTVNGTSSGTNDIYYAITTLEGYTGTLGGKRGKFKIGTLVSSVDPQPGAKLVSLASGTRDFRDLANTVVMYTNVAQSVTLEQKSDGIYVKVSGIDPTTETPTYESTAATAGAAETEAKANIVVPSGVEVEKSTYASYFKYETTGDSGAYTVQIVDIADKVVEDANDSALGVLNGEKDAKVVVPAGLYYKVTTYTALGGTPTVVVPGTTLSDGNGNDATVTKPGDNAGFIEIKIGSTPIK